MKVVSKLTCYECFEQAKAAGASEEDADEASARAYVGTNLTTASHQLIACTLGHKLDLTIFDGGYAMLFERGLQRVAVEQYRDAVVDAYTGFEMFLGYALVAALFEARGGGLKEADERVAEIRSGLKFVLTTSDRTMGALLAVAAMRSGCAPPEIDSEAAAIRNKAVHAGNYPTRAETYRVCNGIERMVRQIEAALPGGDPTLPSFYAFRSLTTWTATIGGAQAHPCSLLFFETLLAGRRTEPDDVERRVEHYRLDRNRWIV